ncbi:MAG: hypothetical protein NC418_04095 [Muribaculaceae bacterium]|nr:hypothetical protein [Muribaculaceae bacterium]
MKKSLIFSFLVVLLGFVSACSDDDDGKGRWYVPPTVFQISPVDSKGYDGLAPDENIPVVLTFQGQEYDLTEGKCSLTDNYSYAEIKKVDYTPGGLYKPRHDIFISIDHDDYALLDEDPIFTISIAGKEYSAVCDKDSYGFLLNGRPSDEGSARDAYFEIVVDK